MVSTSSSSPLVLAINAGSSSVKAALIRKDGSDDENVNYTHVASFVAERLSTEQTKLVCTVHNKDNNGEDAVTEKEITGCDHEQALKHILAFLRQEDWLKQIVATGHRVVHGGEHFTESVLVKKKTLQKIEDVSHLAPLHNPHNIKGIKVLQVAMPNLPVVAVFDTSFHTTLPAQARTYPIPESYREAGIQKYGFHGTSVRYVTEKAVPILQEAARPKKDNYNLVVCHLGNGASVTAVSNQKSVETTMGFSPLSGLIMGTRSGDIDPTVISFAVDHFGLSIDQVLHDLNKESGLKAMVGAENTPDMRDILEHAKQGDRNAELAVEMFVHRLVQKIAASLVALPDPAEAIIFTGGIGEHSKFIRNACAERLRKTILPEFTLDSDLNDNDGEHSNGIVSAKDAHPIGLVIETDEEVMIAKDCFRLVPSKSTTAQ